MCCVNQIERIRKWQHKRKVQELRPQQKKSASKVKVEVKIEPVALDHRDKTAFMVVMISRPEGATLKEMAEALGWKENSIRGAMSAYAKKTGGTIASEKKADIRTYYLKANA